MTRRIFREDAFARAFEARVIDVTTHDGNTSVVLDQTAFYPSAGGQPNDLGAVTLLDAARGTRGVLNVIDVIERPDGVIAHVLDGAWPPDIEISMLSGAIDWSRRFDHMQQHSGQHVLSQAFVRRTELDTIAVHIGADDCTLDLPTARLAQDAIDAAEDEANHAIWANLLFKTYEVDDAGLAVLPLRKTPKVSGRIRIVEIDGYDWSACGGTHVAVAGQIGLIKILKAEKRGTETRVTFRCGGRALRDYRRTLRAMSQMAEGLTVGRFEVPAAIAKLRDEAKSAARQLADARTALVAHEARALLMNAQPDASGRRIVRAVVSDAALLRPLAKALTEADSVVALLGAHGERAMLCFARSPALTSVDVNVLLKRALTTLPSAKGGGSPDFAQGGGGQADAATLDAMLADVGARL
jgi:alanyl-tRNA synthetase